MAGIQIDGVNNKIDFDDDLDTSISANTDDTLVFEAGGTDTMTIINGKVGIGTSPSTNLHIKSTADNSPHLLLENFQNADTDDAAVIELYLNDQTTGGIGDDTDVGVIRFTGDEKDGGTKETYAEIRGVAHDPGQNASNRGHLSFFVQTAGALAETMTIDENRVGIGTNAPDMLLDVTGAISAGAGTDEDLQQWNIGSDNVKAKMTYLDASANRGFAIGTSSQHDFFLRTHNNIGLKVDINGAVTMPLQPAFHVHPSSTQSNFQRGVVVAVKFGTERFDLNSDFSLDGAGTSGTFTAPVTGKYHLSASVKFGELNTDGGTNYYYINIATSNRSYSNLSDVARAGGNDWNLNIDGLFDMDANDTATVQVVQGGSNQGSGIGSSDISADSFFSGHLVA